MSTDVHCDRLAHSPYAVGDKCEWRFIDPIWGEPGGLYERDYPEIWIDAEVIDVRYSDHGFDVRVRTGFGWPSTWTRWVWVDFDGKGWDHFPHRDVRPDEVAEYCRLRLRPLAASGTQVSPQ